MSRTAAINLYCKGCIYDPKAPGTWREQCEQCTSGPDAKVPCPLWQYRPVSVSTVNGNRKTRAVDAELDVDALVAGLEDDDEVDAPEALAV